MRVVIVTIEPFPNGMAAVNRIKCYAKALRSDGVEVEVLTVFRTEHFGKEAKNKEGKGIWEGIPYKYAGENPFRSQNPLLRKINDILDVWRTCHYLKKIMKRGDAVICYMKERSLAIKIAKICHSIGIPCLRDLCEFPYISRIQNKMVEKERASYMRNQFPYFDGIIAISQALFDYSQKHKRPNAKTIKIPILVDTDGYDKERQISSVPFFFHSGTLTEQKDGILGVIEAFGKAKHMYGLPVMYYFTGKLEKSSDIDGIKALITKYELKDSLKFLGYLQEDEMLQYQANCIAMVINKHDNLQNKYCFATKLGEYLLSGRPVITTRVGEAIYYLKDRENAYLYDDNDIDSLSKLMIHVLTNEEDCERIGQNGKALTMNQFDYRKYGRVMREFIEDLNHNH